MKKVNYNENVNVIDKRKENEYYIGDLIKVKKQNSIVVRNCMIAGYNPITKKWIVKYDKETSEGLKYEEVFENEIIGLRGTTIKINEKVPKNYLEIEKFIKRK